MKPSKCWVANGISEVKGDLFLRKLNISFREQIFELLNMYQKLNIKTACLGKNVFE